MRSRGLEWTVSVSAVVSVSMFVCTNVCARMLALTSASHVADFSCLRFACGYSCLQCAMWGKLFGAAEHMNMNCPGGSRTPETHHNLFFRGSGGPWTVHIHMFGGAQLCLCAQA